MKSSLVSLQKSPPRVTLTGPIRKPHRPSPRFTFRQQPRRRSDVLGPYSGATSGTTSSPYITPHHHHDTHSVTIAYSHPITEQQVLLQSSHQSHHSAPINSHKRLTTQAQTRQRTADAYPTLPDRCCTTTLTTSIAFHSGSDCPSDISFPIQAVSPPPPPGGGRLGCTLLCGVGRRRGLLLASA